ncbi:MAG: PadR family transcriptional regulator [Thiobacillus sp. GWE1_62_9]|nr:MAG: PadR family transcriptional regulator [Thiobacillus sp. GWE1_62_9]HBU28724.1 PadR family transcriptional regulator [Thiobacillus sp.]
MSDKDLYSGLIRLHILHHAAEEAVFGLGLIEELRHHGYEISAGTLYPMLHGLEKKGYLVSREERTRQRGRRVYTITPEGREALAAAKIKVKELFGELFEDACGNPHIPR